MSEMIAIVGLDPPEYTDIRDQVDARIMATEVLPGIMVDGGQLWMERNGRQFPVSKVVYHGIFEDDLDFITGLALWGGPCLPDARAMMDCRLKLPCLVRALGFTQFGDPLRGFVSARTRFQGEGERVAKWGNWHCGENKTRFTGNWSGDEAAIIEHFLEGEAVRVVLIGDQAWQIRLTGEGWLKSLHHEAADFMPLDADLLADTQRLQAGFGLQIIANDYIVSPDGSKHLLEVNHIPNVTRFPAIWEAYRDYVVDWLG